ncbi:MAG: hypothetical protein RLY71_4317 [Pseudomonadota bacterium]|jgi:hypothetical protein
MRQVVNLALVVLAALSTSGCAYLTNYTRSVDLDGKSSLSIDVKQRVVFSKKTKTKTKANDANGNEGVVIEGVVICAEPSPDALTVLGASGGLSFNDIAAEKSVGATAALAESGSFVGLRTQSIQLLRDAMYRLCEGYAGEAVTPVEFASMQRRYQSTMMGLIAIEQLTRPVVAAQVALVSNASAGAGASGDDAALEKARSRAEEKAKEVNSAQDEARRARAKWDSAKADVDRNEAAIAKAKADKDTSAEVQLIAGRPALAQALDAANLDRLAAEDRLGVARDLSRKAEADLAAARTRSNASAGGNAKVDSTSAATVQTTRELVDGVREIVAEINKSYTKEGCFGLIERLVVLETRQGFPARAEEKNAIQEGVELCKQILTSEVNIAEKVAETKRLEAEARLTRESNKKDSTPGRAQGEGGPNEQPPNPAGGPENNTPAVVPGEGSPKPAGRPANKNLGKP